MSRAVLLHILTSLWLVPSGCAPRLDAPSDDLARGGGASSSWVTVRKGVWLVNVGSSVFKSRAELKTALMTLHGMGVNTVYPVVWNKGLTSYNSATLKKLIGLAADPKLGGRSALSEIFSIIKETGIKMEVIPWFEYGIKVYVGLSDAQVKATLAGPPEALAPEFRFAHVMHKRGLLAKTLEGNVVWKDPHIKANYAFLDPSKSEAREILRSLVDEVTGSYPVAGIQFDDHFSLHYAFGGVPEDWDPLRHQDREKEKFFYWKKYMMGEIVYLAKVIADTAKRNGVAVRQISPAGSVSFSNRVWSQDWQAFLRTEAFNEVLLQAYRDDVSEFQRLLSSSDTWGARKVNQRSVGIFTGTTASPRSTDLLVSQIEIARNRVLGVNFFHYDSLVGGSPGKPDAERIARIKEALSKPWVCHQELKSFCGP